MKKMISGLLCLLLLGNAAPAFAADTVAAQTETASLSWDELEGRIQAGSLHALVLSENIDGIQAINYNKMASDLRTQMSVIGNQQWALVQAGADSTAEALESSYKALSDALDDIRDGTKSCRTTQTASGSLKTPPSSSC